MKKLMLGDVIKALLLIPDKSVQTIVTSPPYYSLRDYKLTPTKWPKIVYRLFGLKIVVKPQTCCLGLENSPEDFIGHLIHIFRLAKPTLKDNGTLWINLGDSYWGGKGKSGQSYSPEYQKERYNKGRSFNGAHHQIAGKNQTRAVDGKHDHIKPKDLVGIPWMFAFAMREDGWYLRQDIIWSKTNCMPESVLDRCTKSHEYIFLFSKNQKYYFDSKAIQEPAVGTEDANGFRGGSYTHDSTFDNEAGGKRKTSGNKQRKSSIARGAPEGTGKNQCGSVPWEGNSRNKRSVWEVATRQYKKAHFATFSEKLITPCILAGSKEGDVVMDIFGGSGTTGILAEKLKRNWVLIEASPFYHQQQKENFYETFGAFTPNIDYDRTAND